MNRKQRMMENNNGWPVVNQLLDGAPFFAQLTNSLVLNRGTGSPTYTGATTKTVTDNEGVMRTAIAGEARFVGARRVRNLLTQTESFGANWVKEGAITHSVSNGVLTLNLPANQTDRLYVAGGANPSTTIIDSVYLWASAPTTVVLRHIRNVGGDTNKTISVTTTPTRYTTDAISSGATNTNNFLAIVNSENVAKTVFVQYPQMEDITGRTDQTTPSEYVSVGVLSAPYHGAGVDGVKYFDTDLSGNPIAASTLKGYLAEPAATNLCLQSADLGTTWTNNNTTESTNATTAPDGTTTADKLIEAATNTSHTIHNTVAGTSGVYTTSVYLKAAERTWAYITEGNSVTATAYFNLANGVVGTVNGTGSPSSKIVDVGGGWYRCSMTFTAGANANIQIGTSTGDTISTFLGDITKGIYVWGAQLELGSAATSYIPTTTVAVARNADVLTYPSAGNIDGTVGWCYAEYSTLGSNPNARVIGCGDTASANTVLFASPTAGSKASIYDGTASVSSTGVMSAVNTVVNGATTWGGSTMSACADGETPVSGAFDGNIALTGGIGIGVGGSVPWNGHIGNVRIGHRQLSNSELQAITR